MDFICICPGFWDLLSSLDPTMKAGALDEFLGGADPWIIAKAYVQTSPEWQGDAA
jgi:hypothetical protein